VAAAVQMPVLVAQVVARCLARLMCQLAALTLMSLLAQVAQAAQAGQIVPEVRVAPQVLLHHRLR
jgi:hypothetical protein